MHRSMKELLIELYPLNRLLVGDDNDKALAIIQEELPEMEICKIPSGTECWTWIVPEKWTVNSAYVSDGENKLIDFADHPLHLLSHSLPMDQWVTKEELMEHLYYAESHLADGGYTVPERPDAIPWRLKYYERDWGFCIQKSKLEQFTQDKYYVKIDTEFTDGNLCIGDFTIPGETDETIVIISDICHPAQVNDSISGAVVAVNIAQQLSKRKNHYTYKFVFLPETIGAIAYLSQNEQLIPNMVYAIFSEMLGHKNSFVLQHSRQGNSRIDHIAEYVLEKNTESFRTGKFREVICNDELIFNGPGVNVPTISLSRYPFPEYHTSDDNPDIIFEDMLEEASDIVLKIIHIVDNDFLPKRNFKGIVFLSRYGLWVDWRKGPEYKVLGENIEKILLLLEGDMTVFDIANKLNVNFDMVLEFIIKLEEHNLIERV